MYERKAGYNGKQHGEIKLSTPAPKAKKRFTSSNNFHPHAKSYIHSIKILVKIHLYGLDYFRQYNK